jgi:tRNA wybutosine-synthesizing protein 2
LNFVFYLNHHCSQEKLQDKLEKIQLGEHLGFVLYMPFRDRILKINPDLSNIPNGYKRIENKIILRHQNELDTDLGKVILTVYPWCTGVFQHLNTYGENRRPELKHLAGEKNTIVTHTENFTKYHLDISKITFSGGNSNLRKRLIQEVKAGEHLLDMFSAVGNLSLQVLKHKKVDAILVEKDPYTFKFLEKTIALNNIKNCETLNFDCIDIEVENWADRVFMGYHDVNESHMKAAIKACRALAIIHIHPLAFKGEYNSKIEEYVGWINNLNVRVVNQTARKIKNYSPNLDHIEIVLSIQK